MQKQLSITVIAIEFRTDKLNDRLELWIRIKVKLPKQMSHEKWIRF